MLELRGRQIHRHAQVRRPASGRIAGFLEHPGSERVDQADLFGERDELGRRQRPARRMGPAHQGLVADQLPAVGLEQRLIVQSDLIGPDRLA